ncbi:EAL domain-containing protein [Mitsuaria sp. GD03876]|uniref:EAL domain-containing protein n=1 Tax=Mitsuaria sp. GD03876 TaxID=2975399 RepID=UPI00244A16C1|nr:EAL domain-containing protein [Mitsuaria sp. GD03876]MDH0867491.1 EAL domain-containing protein [Mitsuaria sp. GD03876]
MEHGLGNDGDDAEVEAMLRALYGAIGEERGRWIARFEHYRLSSAFQPVYSFPHRRPVGYEGLIRVEDDRGRAVAPVTAFEGVGSFDQQVWLDRLCRLLHVHNFVAQGQPDCWLFLNIHPAVFMHAALQVRMLARAVEVVHQLGLPTHRLVFEVTEDVMARDDSFEDAVEAARATGCLLALDDFGVGHSNFDRIWRIRPEIVKLDRSLLRRSRGSRRMARVLSQMVALLHECGALVLLEGIETAEDAQLAMDADVDLVQGFAFGHPAPFLRIEEGVSALEDVWSLFNERQALLRRDHLDRLTPFRTAIALALQPLQQSRPLAESCHAFLALQGAQMCYLLDEDGREIGPRAVPASGPAEIDPRFLPMERAGDARWARRPYFRRAVESVGEVQTTRPYLSLHGARMCVTVSVAYWQGGRLRVLCGDLDWDEV